MSRWVPDKEAPTCRRCGFVFTFRKRRHHCRRCGNVVCDACSQQKQELQPGLPPERVCDLCVFIIDVPDLFQAPDDPRPSQYAPISHQPSILHAASPPHSAPSSQAKNVVFKNAHLQAIAASSSTSGTSLSTTDVHSELSANTSSVTESKDPVLRRMRSASLGEKQDEDLVVEFFKDISEDIARKYNRHAPVSSSKGKPTRPQGNYQTMQTTSHSRPPNLLLHQGARSLTPSHRSTHSMPDNYGAILRPFAKPPELIRQLIAMLASPEGLVYMSQECESPFQATAHPASIEALEELLGKGQQVGFGAVLPEVRNQLPNLLKSYVSQSDYHFGEDVASDLQMASVCAAIITDGRFYKSFSAICIAFSALKDLEPAFLQVYHESR